MEALTMPAPESVKTPVMPVMSSTPGVDVGVKVMTPELLMPLPAMVKVNESAFAAGEIAKAVAIAITMKLIFFIISLKVRLRERM